MATSNGQSPDTELGIVNVAATVTDADADVVPIIDASASATSPSPSPSPDSSVVVVKEEEEEVKRRRRCCNRKLCRRIRSNCREVKKELKLTADEINDLGRRGAKKVCTVDAILGIFPIIKWLPKYRFKQLQGDFIAGLTVGLTVIPQGLAYAQVANLSPEYGLYSAFVGCFIYMIFGTSKDITLGPTAIMSLLTAEFCVTPIDRDPTYAILLSFFGGIIQLFMGIIHIGFIVDYISHPVINSFTTAAAITIAEGQLKKWFGLRKVPRDFINELYWSLRKLPETRLWDFLMGLTCILALYGLKKTRVIRWGKPEGMSRAKRALKYVVWLSSTARNAIIVVLASVVASVFLQYKMQPFSLTGNIKAGVPPFKPPPFTKTFGNETMSTPEMLANLGTGLAIVPILGLVETIAIGKAFARKSGYSIDANQELLAVGASNIVGSFVGAYPVTGSFSRTAVNAQSGSMTPASGIWTATLVLLALAFLTPLFYYIPDAALAAVIIMAVIDMIDFSLLIKLWRVKKLDLIPWIVTFVCSLLIGIEWGIIIGIGLSQLCILYPWARPKIHINLVQMSNDDMIVMTLNQGLAFPGMEYFKDKVYSKALSGDNFKSVVLDFDRITVTDFTTVEGVHQLLDDFVKKNKKLVLCNMQPNILNSFLRAELKHFEYAPTVDEAIALIRSDIEKTSSGDGSISPAAAGDIEGGSWPPDLIETPDIERCNIYNAASDDEDPTDDEAYEKNYIVTSF